MLRNLFKVLTLLAFGTALATAAIAAGPGFPRTEKYFNQLDADKDGKLSIAEVAPRTEKRLFRIDGNGDGNITREEIESWLQKGLERRRNLMLADYDADNNGAITREELATFLSSEFGKADKDGDGAMTLDESRAYRFVRDDEAKQAEEDDE
jgi:Ca2+-binding EF-hand superfamily protein